jgi:glycosyltransferase involved in cell wall biosynthesis
MRLLVASYYYPPWAFPAANRWAAMTKYLRQLGHEVTVVTTSAPVVTSNGLGSAEGVVRTSDLNSNATLRKLLRRAPIGSEPATLGATTAAGPPALLTKVIVPDAYLVSWTPWARQAIARLLREQRFDCLITTGPPDSTHLLGLALGRRRPAWIAEFRDGWLFQPLRAPFATGPQRALERWLERRVATQADAVVGVTGPIAEDFRSRLGVPAELIRNGWDPHSAQLVAAPSALLDERRFTFLHTGTMSGEWGRSPRPFLEALGRLLEADPALEDHIAALFVGVATGEDLRLLEDPRWRAVVRYGGIVDRPTVLSLQRAASTLVLLTSTNTGEATGKLFEYLGSGRPIIAVAGDNEAARIIGETGTGVSVPPGDVEAIAAQIRRAIDGELASSYAPHSLERYSYPGPAQLMAEVAERAVSARTPRNGVQ